MFKKHSEPPPDDNHAYTLPHQFCRWRHDLAAFYSREPGAVLSTAIKKYMYITVNRRFDDTVRVSYSHTEIVSTAPGTCNTRLSARHCG